jgi:HAD superfamily hydrolase (TIGR01509 family)
VLDVGGVIVDRSSAVAEGMRRGFVAEGLPFDYTVQEVWRTRGTGRYENSLNCIKALLALNATGKGVSLGKLLENRDAEARLDLLVGKLGEQDLAVADRIREKYKEYFYSDEARSLVKRIPGAEDAITMLRGKGYHLAIFSNDKMSSINRDIPFLEWFDAVLSEESVTKKKPSGEGIVKILSMLRVQRQETVYVGDAGADIRAARDAGCGSVALLSGSGTRVSLEPEKPDYLFDDLIGMARAFCGATTSL